VGASCEITNLDLVRRLLGLLGKPESLIRFVADRPGHDRRYALDPSRIRTELGWRPRHSADDGLAATVEWYRRNEAWWSRVLTEAYRATNALYLRGSA
jgi:dTDP-glucose 4,6-dehydratase